MAFDLELLEEIIKARTIKECFMVDLPDEPRRRFGPRLVLKSLVDHRYGAHVCFRLFQRSVWHEFKLQNYKGFWSFTKPVRLSLQRHKSNVLLRIMSLIFLTRISSFTEIYPGMIATFDNLGMTAGCRIHSGVIIDANVTLVNNRALAPTILEGTKLLTGCVIIGGVSVGPNAVVTPNSVVVKDVPEGATVTGNPARVVSSTITYD